jgi:hypothetical protein
MAALVSATCASVPATPDSSEPPVVVQLTPDRAWTDTPVVVRRGERLMITATGEVSWVTTGKSAGPDGVSGYPGWPVADGGLVGRVGGTSKTFDIGSRTSPLHDRNLRSQATYSPSALVMPDEGMLQLGFKHFQPGANRGRFEVTIQRAR